MGASVNKRRAGQGDEFHRVLLNHVGSVVTITEDLGGVLQSATHNTTGIIDVTWNPGFTGGAVPGMSGIICASNLVGHVISPTATTCQINTKLNNTGANFTAGRIEFYVKREN